MNQQTFNDSDPLFGIDLDGDPGVASFISPASMPIKCDIETLQNPYFALSSRDRSVRAFDYGRTESGSIQRMHVIPSSQGAPSKIEREFWLFLVSKASLAIHHYGMTDLHTVRGTVGEFIRFAGRSTCGKSYRNVSEALARITARLSGVRLIVSDTGSTDSQGWRVIGEEESPEEIAELLKNSDGGSAQNKSRLIEAAKRKAMGAELWTHEGRNPHCFFEARLGQDVCNRLRNSKNILTLSPDYFKISKQFDRRVYEVARKFLGRKSSWTCHVDRFIDRLGSSDKNRRKLLMRLRKLGETNPIPGMRVEVVTDNSRGGERPFYVRVMAAKSMDSTRESTAESAASSASVESKEKTPPVSHAETGNESSEAPRRDAPESLPETPDQSELTASEQTAWDDRQKKGESLIHRVEEVVHFHDPNRAFETIDSGKAHVTIGRTDNALPAHLAPRPGSASPKGGEKVYFGYPESQLRGELEGFARPGEMPFDTAKRLYAYHKTNPNKSPGAGNTNVVDPLIAELYQIDVHAPYGLEDIALIAGRALAREETIGDRVPVALNSVYWFNEDAELREILIVAMDRLIRGKRDVQWERDRVYTRLIGAMGLSRQQIDAWREEVAAACREGRSLYLAANDQ